MSYRKTELDRIFASTAGRCHLCRGTLCRRNYGRPESRGAWEVDHSRPKAKGGADHLNNLRPAHIGCNRSKQATATRTIRARNGIKHAPISATREADVRGRNTAIGASGCAVVGGVIGGPLGAALGAVLGGIVGHLAEVE